MFPISFPIFFLYFPVWSMGDPRGAQAVWQDTAYTMQEWPVGFCSQVGLPHATATRGHVPLMGLSHDRVVCEGLPDLPAAHQEITRPTGMSQAVSPPLDGQIQAVSIEVT